jgi:hypothetical protein
MRWGKIEGHDSVRQQNIIERAGVALWSRGSWRANYSKPSDDIHDVILGDAPSALTKPPTTATHCSG